MRLLKIGALTRIQDRSGRARLAGAAVAGIAVTFAALAHAANDGPTATAAELRSSVAAHLEAGEFAPALQIARAANAPERTALLQVIADAQRDRITELVRVLQTRLQLQSVDFSISPGRREAVENELIAEALGAFKARAEMVRQNLGAASYRIVHVGIASDGTVPAPLPIRSMAAMSEGGAAPALEPGTSTVTVTVDGTLELRK